MGRRDHDLAFVGMGVLAEHSGDGHRCDLGDAQSTRQTKQRAGRCSGLDSFRRSFDFVDHRACSSRQSRCPHGDIACGYSAAGDSVGVHEQSFKRSVVPPKTVQVAFVQ